MSRRSKELRAKAEKLKAVQNKSEIGKAERRNKLLTAGRRPLV
jgi:hypothetical protein